MPRVAIDVLLKRELLDPQGRATERALPGLGYDGVSDVRFGQEVGVRTVGVANDAANARALLGQGPDLVVCRTADLVPHMDVVLGRGGSARPGPGG